MAQKVKPIDHELTFIPWQSVGIFKFDDEIDNYQAILSDWEHEPKDKFNTEYYRRADDNVLIGVAKGKLRNVFCYDTLIYQGINLIGLSINLFRFITKSHYAGVPSIEDFEEDGYPQTVYEFEDIGAQVWEKKGKIVTIIVAGRESYSDEPCTDEDDE